MLRQLALAVTLLAVPACGSTAQQVSTLPDAGGAGLVEPGPGLAGDGLGAPAPGDDASVLVGPGTDSGVGGAGRAGSGGGSARDTRAGADPGGPVTAAQAATAAPGGARQGPGVTDKAIAVGLPYGTNGRAAAAAFGATGEGAGGGDGRRIWTVALKLINDSGGVLGRKLTPVWYEIDSTSSETAAAREQAMCTTFTQDNKVFWASVTALKTATPCLQKAGVSQSTSSPTDAGTAFYEQYPNYIEAGTLQMDRVALSMPELLERQGWFGAWNTANGTAGGAAPVRIGVVSFDDPYTKHAVRNILAPGLKRIAGTDPILVEVQTPQSASDNGSAITAMQNATLRFRQEGVTHVIPFETQGAGIGVFVSQGADKQGYYPRYGVNSGNAVQLYVDQGLWPTTQLNGTLGFGWQPLLDLSNSANPDDGPYSNDERRRCLTAMTRAGVDVSSAIIKRQALEYCTNLRFLKAALEAGGTTVSPASFRAGAERLGTSFQSALTFATRYDQTRHDGVSQVRTLAYQSSCGCLKYGSALLPVP